jgi:branched-chain amino acid aminotransferase
MQTVPYIWMDGRLVKWEDAKTHVLTFTLHYGAGVFEGIRAYKTHKGTAVFRLKDHMKRLSDSAKKIRMKLPYSIDELVSATKETVASNKLEAGYIRPIAFFGYGEMGLKAKNRTSVAIACWPWGAYLGEAALAKGVRCKVSSWRRIDSRTLPTSAKVCGFYVNSILASLDATESGYEEAILLNTGGNVAEGPGENIFVVKDGQLITPPLSAGILEGITRDSIIRIAKDMKMTVVERNIKQDQLFDADEAFFTGTAAEVTPIREIDGIQIGEGRRGPVTEKLQSKFYDIVKGKDRKYYKWLDFVK